MLLDDIFSELDTDSSHMLDTLGQFAHHIQQAIDIVDNINLPKIYNIHNIIISGFGGSVISGDIIQSYLQSRLSIPIFVNRSPELPGWIRKNTLVFIQSYSGDTDETMLSFRNAVEKKATIIGVSSGGKLKRYCDARSLPHILLPSRFQSRTALPFYLFCCLRSLEITGLLTLDQKTAYNESMNMAKETISQINSSVPSEHNVSKQIALSISDTIPQLYSYGIYRPITRRWASQFNENSKIISKYDDITESNHNDINGWAENPRLSHLFSCIFFRDKPLEHPIIRKRIEFMKQLFESVSSKIIEVPVIGKQDLEKMIYLLLVGDYASCYLAYLRNVEPAAHPIIKTLNEELSR